MSPPEFGTKSAGKASKLRLRTKFGGARHGEWDRCGGKHATRARGKNGDSLGKEERLGDIVGHEECREALALPEGEEFLIEPLPSDVVERGEGFVQ
jgi:hypothetical protein